MVRLLRERNITILITSQLIFVTGSALLVTITGIVGSRLSVNPALATLPVSLIVIGTASATVPASLLMRRVGRPVGFTVAAINSTAGALLAAYAIGNASFALFCVSTAMLGTGMAFGQQFRFAAAESVEQHQINNAISLILLGSIGGALLGPFLAANGGAITPTMPYQGGLLVAAALYLSAAFLFSQLRDTASVPEDANTDNHPRPLGIITRQPLFLLAVLAGVVGQGVMVYIMTATPVSMHVMGPHDLDATASVVRAHILAMYLPSLISGTLVSRFGHRRMMTIGAFLLLATIGVGFVGQHLMHYWSVMVLLGLGWNFLFVGGTTLLVHTYRSNERFKAQAVNEFSVFGTSAAVSLLAGTMLHTLGWQALLLSASPFVLLMLVALFQTRGDAIAR
ncbi:MAG: MFS transporter [Pseudomonadales bacterium]|nr:MFS transporter [Pseudomonadales bacterium]MDP6971988.1 MFS transporter [Pseudomonadales bacterium]